MERKSEKDVYDFLYFLVDEYFATPYKSILHEFSDYIYSHVPEDLMHNPFKYKILDESWYGKQSIIHLIIGQTAFSIYRENKTGHLYVCGGHIT